MAIKDRLYGVPVVGTALRVQDRYREDAADQLAASIGFFGFLSLFPLIILAVGIGGFVIRNTPGAEVDVVNAIRDAIPGLSGLGGTDLDGVVSDVAQQAGAIAGIGAITLLLSGLRVVNGAMIATSRVFRMPMPEGARGWGRKLAALFGLGALALLGAAAASGIAVPTEVVPAPVRIAIGIIVTLLVDLGLFLVAYRVMAAGRGPAWRDLLPGAVLAAVGWTLLKTAGSAWVAGQADRANELYGTFGGIIALLLLLYLAGRLYLYGAELSAVLCERHLDRDVEPRPGSLAAALAGGPDAARLEPAARGGGRGSLQDAGPGQDDEPGPPPAPRVATSRAPTSEQPAVTVSDQTRTRMAALDSARGGRRADVRGAIAFTLAAVAVGGLLVASRPWQTQDD